MSKLLSNEQIWKNDGIMAVNAEAGLTFDVLAKLVSAIESAVLEAQGKQKPVAEVVKATGSLKDIHIIRWMNEYEAKEGDKLYAAPVVQPDTVLVPREPTEAMLRAMEKQWMYGSQEDMAKREYRAMIAAAEGKK